MKGHGLRLTAECHLVCPVRGVRRVGSGRKMGTMFSGSRGGRTAEGAGVESRTVGRRPSTSERVDECFRDGHDRIHQASCAPRKDIREADASM
jgi:hypothetical protein